MKYQDFINLVEEEVREEDAWPTDASKVGRQIDLSYLAALAVGAELPLAHLTIESSSLILGTAFKGNLYQVAMPDDIYDLRPDMGINRIEVDGEAFYFNQTLPVQNILSMASNGIFNSDKRVAFDITGRKIYILNPTSANLFHVKLPVKPADGDVGTADYPLSDKDAHRAVQVVAFHINGVTIRDSAAAQFNALLEKQYGEPVNG